MFGGENSKKIIFEYQTINIRTCAYDGCPRFYRIIISKYKHSVKSMYLFMEGFFFFFYEPFEKLYQYMSIKTHEISFQAVKTNGTYYITKCIHTCSNVRLHALFQFFDRAFVLRVDTYGGGGVEIN